MTNHTDPLKSAAAALGRKGGKSKSPAKLAALAENRKRGGRKPNLPATYAVIAPNGAGAYTSTIAGARQVARMMVDGRGLYSILDIRQSDFEHAETARVEVVIFRRKS